MYISRDKNEENIYIRILYVTLAKKKSFKPIKYM